ncbi:OTU domain-containing protein [Legionella fairfieldensis]|uniref:OTU domain-containing protein n=1 Tax=Legionella fairfieldensis TaxID=45064 RepID=UPI00048ABB7C|nr:hypothetical protein [Legionella fairfieldensis]
MGANPSGFFSGKTTDLAFIDVGGEKDCGFRSVAAAMVSHIVFHPAFNQQLARKLLDHYYKYFTIELMTERYLTPADYFTFRIKATGRATFVNELAFVLRQVTVDELRAHPLYYCNVLMSNRHLSLKAMRLQDAWLNEFAMIPLANALQIPIIVQAVESNKSLFKSLIFNGGAAKPVGRPVIIQLIADHNYYIPLVDNSEFFKGLNHGEKVELYPKNEAEPMDIDAQYVIEPMDVDSQNETESMDIDAKEEKIPVDIDAEDGIKLLAIRLYDELVKHVRRLSKMIELKELSHEDLLAIRIRGLADRADLQKRMKYAGLEYGYQSFFEAVQMLAKGVHPVTLPAGNSEDLIYAAACELCIGQLDPAWVYEREEKLTLGSP